MVMLNMGTQAELHRQLGIDGDGIAKTAEKMLTS